MTTADRDFLAATATPTFCYTCKFAQKIENKRRYFENPSPNRRLTKPITQSFKPVISEK